ncbi:unnamed protein product [Spirodela intermedia]|uniref:RING-type E3 ubiquitin transferase n=1 Tax=Spirodela intermedia TaxID=51605 RepID=A0A7I8JVL0_SPIIN|nr:unnamed protein product [Spirodela intermedia]CAA6673801.1 unnamed protein product [Spirodela intermedia]
MPLPGASSSSPSPGASRQMILVHRGSSSSAVAAAETPPAPSSPTGRSHRRGRDDDDQKMLIESLPLFTHRSSITVLPKLSQDCAVCLSGFRSDDQLRILPYCCHAFHSTCIDTWLRSSLFCPLCRTSILQGPLPPPPPAPPPPLPLPAPETSAALATQRDPTLLEASRSRSAASAAG